MARSEAGWAQASDDGAGRRGAQRAVDAQLGQQGRQAQLLQGPQADLLDADAAGADQAQRVDVDRCTSVGPAAGPLHRCAAGDQLCGYALRFAFDGGRAIGHQGRLAGQDVVAAGADQRPLRLGNVEVASEIEQGALADGVPMRSEWTRRCERSRAVRRRPPGLGAANEHTPTIAGARPRSNNNSLVYGSVSYRQHPIL